jgi:hypothetical protein
MTGRPSTFTQEQADVICDRLVSGRSLRSICADADMPQCSTVMKWLERFPAFAEQYARARELQADTIFDEILHIADETAHAQSSDDIQAARLRIDARKWMAGKLRPKKYSDKIDHTLSGPDGQPIQVAHANVGDLARTLRAAATGKLAETVVPSILIAPAPQDRGADAADDLL